MLCREGNFENYCKFVLSFSDEGGSCSADRLYQIEKPFGHDLESSRELQRNLDPNWSEEEIFRVDHYLGKEVVNNLLVLRFGNEIFGGIWNHDNIDSVQVGRFLRFISATTDNSQISMAEGGGAEGRGSYYESTGVIRDVMQNRESYFFMQALY